MIALAPQQKLGKKQYDNFSYIVLVLIVGLIFLGRTRAPWLLFDLIFLISFAYAFFSRTVNRDLINIGLLIGILLLFTSVQFYIFGQSLLKIFRVYYNIRFIFIIYFISQLILRDQIDIKKLLFQIYIIGCIQFFLNIPFIIMEYRAEPWNIDEHNGMFGHGSSHAAGIFWLFLINYGLMKDQHKFLTAILILLGLYLSSLTDNKFFYVAIMLSVATYVSKKPKLIIQAVFLSVLALVLMAISYRIVPEFRDFIDNAIFRSYDVYVNSDNTDRSERSQILDYILHFRDSYIFGQGMGEISSIFDMEGKQVNKLIHINMNELFIQIFETGVLNTIVLIACYSFTFAMLWNKKRLLVFAVMTPIITFMFYYSRFLSDPRQIFFFMLTVICYSIPNFSEVPKPKKVRRTNYQVPRPNFV